MTEPERPFLPMARVLVLGNPALAAAPGAEAEVRRILTRWFYGRTRALDRYRAVVVDTATKGGPPLPGPASWAVDVARSLDMATRTVCLAALGRPLWARLETKVQLVVVFWSPTDEDRRVQMDYADLVEGRWRDGCQGYRWSAQYGRFHIIMG